MNTYLITRLKHQYALDHTGDQREDHTASIQLAVVVLGIIEGLADPCRRTAVSSV